MPRRTKSFLSQVVGCISLLLLSLAFTSCSTPRPTKTALSNEFPMSRNAGRGNPLLVMVKVAGSKPMPMVLDTGMPITFLDQSLEAKLGKRIRSSTLWTFGTAHKIGYYPAPKLFLGSMPLSSSNLVCTVDCRNFGMPEGVMVKGIIGMDVLRHHCIQLEFQQEIIRLIDSNHSDTTNWGQAFPLTDIGDGCYITPKNLTGKNEIGTIIDTGFSGDGWLTAKSYQNWTNHTSPAVTGEARSPKGILGNETYLDLKLDRTKGDVNKDDFHTKYNGIGLGVLARHLVTLDFPNHTMYLKRFGDWRPVPKELKAKAEAVVETAVMFLKGLEAEGKLPGWRKKDKGGPVAYHFEQRELKTLTLDVKKKDDSSFYHYTLTRDSEKSPWVLNRVWRTDQNGEAVEEFKVP